MEFTLRSIAPEAHEVVLVGSLDAYGAEAIEARFARAMDAIDRHVLVDLGSVDFVASLGLRLIIAMARIVQRADRQMVLFAPSALVEEVFEMVALSDLVPVVATRDEALARIGLG